ncbi:UNVERIFIED_CONTAM: hypothetical protein Sindi_1293900 [Sesamum indicum]
MEEVIEGGPWLFQGQPIVLQKWEPGMAMRKLKHTQVPVWIKLRHLPMEFWTTDGLSTAASGVGKPLYPDAITRACTRLDFARVCVMIDVTQKIEKHIIITTPDEDGGETPCKVDVEYEWLPAKCTNCMTLGHTVKDCTLNKPRKPTKPPIAVYVQKATISPQPTAPEKGSSTLNHTADETPRREENDVHFERNVSQHSDKGKEVVIYNAFDALHLLDDAEEPTRGPNISSPDLVSEYRLHFLGILETRVRLNNVIPIQSFLLPQWKWFVDYATIGNRIWLAWDENIIDVHVLESGEQFLHCRVTSRTDNEVVIITIVYGASEVIDRRALWTTLGTMAQQCTDDPWLVGGGDFNTVRNLNEVCGILGDIRMAMEEFNAGIQEAGLLPLPMQGEWYTWHNCCTTTGSLWKQLDRILINDRWLARFPTSSYHCLTPRTSDHSPLVLYIHNNKMEHEVVGVPMYAVSRKLKALKPVFKQQRRNKGDLTLNVQLAKGFLEEAQNLVSSDRQNELFLFLEHCCRLVYAKAKRAVRRILQINDENGTTHTEPSEEVTDVGYWWILITSDLGRGIYYPMRRLATYEPFSLEDVKQAIFDIAEDKAPGPDGFSSGFIKAAWPVVGTEVTRAVLDFFTMGKLLKQNTTLLALIPKVITKLLVQWLSMVLDKLISPRQTAFIPGRSIGDNIMLAQELFIEYNQIRLPPRCALKVDIRKAYDTVEWGFLVAVLQFFNFPTTFIRWIEECLTTASFSIGINGKPHGLFNRARGLRQGDPLSPYLFVLVMEVLHLEFLQLIEQDMQFTYHWKCEPARVFQLGFADDLLLFCRADMDSVRVFKMGLDRFAEWSGLRLNIQKSHLILSRGFQEGHLPMRYLGLPLLSSRLSISDCQPLLSKIDARITGWEGISLSYAGRVQIIKSVLSTLSLYWASAFILPKAVIKEVEKRLRTFLWKGTSMTGYAKVAWKDIWRFPDGQPTTQALYRLFCPPGPKVGWTSLLSGSLKIPRHSFILWMAIQEKLPTTDRPWLTYLGGCILCNEEALETHSHLFFRCRFSRLCLAAVRRIIRVPWPNREWGRDVEWATRKWRGKHIN